MKITSCRNIPIIIFITILVYSNIFGQSDQKTKIELSSDMLKNVASMTVKITNNTGKKPGSGIVIGNTKGGRVLILTACHVVSSNYEIYKTDKTIALKYYDSLFVKIASEIEPLETKLLVKEDKNSYYIDPANDIAVLATKKKVADLEHVMNYRENMECGEIAAVSGYPHAKRLHQVPATIIADDGNFFEFQATVSKEAGVSGGNSGGPLTDEKGRMVGMVVSMNQRKKEGKAIKMNLVATTVNNWLEDRIWVNRFWKKKNKRSFLEKMYKNPWYIGTEAVIVGGIIYLATRNGGNGNGEPIFGKPQDPPIN